MSLYVHIFSQPSLQEVDLVCGLEPRFSQPHCLHQHSPVEAHERCGYPVLVACDAEAIQTMPACTAVGIALVDVKQILMLRHGTLTQHGNGCTAQNSKHMQTCIQTDFTRP